MAYVGGSIQEAAGVEYIAVVCGCLSGAGARIEVAECSAAAALGMVQAAQEAVHMSMTCSVHPCSVRVPYLSVLFKHRVSLTTALTTPFGTCSTCFWWRRDCRLFQLVACTLLGAPGTAYFRHSELILGSLQVSYALPKTTACSVLSADIRCSSHVALLLLLQHSFALLDRNPQ